MAQIMKKAHQFVSAEEGFRSNGFGRQGGEGRQKEERGGEKAPNLGGGEVNVLHLGCGGGHAGKGKEDGKERGEGKAPSHGGYLAASGLWTGMLSSKPDAGNGECIIDAFRHYLGEHADCTLRNGDIRAALVATLMGHEETYGPRCWMQTGDNMTGLCRRIGDGGTPCPAFAIQLFADTWRVTVIAQKQDSKPWIWGREYLGERAQALYLEIDDDGRFRLATGTFVIHCTFLSGVLTAQLQQAIATEAEELDAMDFSFAGKGGKKREGKKKKKKRKMKKEGGRKQSRQWVTIREVTEHIYTKVRQKQLQQQQQQQRQLYGAPGEWFTKGIGGDKRSKAGGKGSKAKGHWHYVPWASHNAGGGGEGRKGPKAGGEGQLLKKAKEWQNLKQKRDTHAKSMEEAATKAAAQLDEMDIKLTEIEVEHQQAKKEMEEQVALHKRSSWKRKKRLQKTRRPRRMR